MWELHCEESWAPKNWCFWTVVLEKTLESPLDCKEIQPVHPKGDPSWVFIGRTDAEAETPIFWPPHVKSWLTGKDSDAGRDWAQKENGTTEDEMAGWQHWLDGHEFEWTLGVGDGQGGLACCSPWGRKESDMTERLNWTELNWWYSGVWFLTYFTLCNRLYVYLPHFSWFKFIPFYGWAIFPHLCMYHNFFLHSSVSSVVLSYSDDKVNQLTPFHGSLQWFSITCRLWFRPSWRLQSPLSLPLLPLRLHPAPCPS